MVVVFNLATNDPLQAIPHTWNLPTRAVPGIQFVQDLQGWMWKLGLPSYSFWWFSSIHLSLKIGQMVQ
jgi:hypothetical protein